MKKDSNFNIFNEKENKIEYCFTRLLYYTEYLNINLEYKHINYEISIILIYIKKWLKTYIKFKSLKDIDNSDIDKVLKIIDDLFETKKINKLIRRERGERGIRTLDSSLFRTIPVFKTGAINPIFIVIFIVK